MKVSIRTWKQTDAASLATALSNKKIQNNLRDGLPYPYTEKDALDYINFILSSDPHDTFAYAIDVDGVAVGSIGAFRKENIHYRTAEIGYYLAEDYWGKGVMTEAVRLLCEDVFAKTDIIRIFAEPFAYNTPSRRVLEKAGFQFEGIMKCNAVKNGKILDMALYGITRQIGVLRRFRKDDEFAVSNVISTTLAISNRKDYSPAFIEENIKSHSPEVIAERAEESHFYVAMDGESLIGCGGITGYWGSTEESYLTSIFVLPDYQGKGVGRKIIETLEADEYFQRAWRTEVGASLTAVPFYQKMGYEFKNGITDPDEYGVVRLEKRKKV